MICYQIDTNLLKNKICLYFYNAITVKKIYNSKYMLYTPFGTKKNKISITIVKKYDRWELSDNGTIFKINSKSNNKLSYKDNIEVRNNQITMIVYTNIEENVIKFLLFLINYLFESLNEKGI